MKGRPSSSAKDRRSSVGLSRRRSPKGRPADPTEGPSRPPTSAKDRRDRAGLSSGPFAWAGREGWARPPLRRRSIHYWRHGRSLCAAYVWRDDWKHPELVKSKADHPHPWYEFCRRCEARSQRAHRYLSRDRWAKR